MKLLKLFLKSLIAMDLEPLISMNSWIYSKIIKLIYRKTPLSKCFKEINLLSKSLKLSSVLKMTYKGLKMFLKHKKTGLLLKHNNKWNQLIIRINYLIWLINYNLNMSHQLLKLWWNILVSIYKEKL